MPIKKVRKQGIIGYQWGDSGTWYSTKDFGVHEAYIKARKQGTAILVSQGCIKVNAHARRNKNRVSIVRTHSRRRKR